MKRFFLTIIVLSMTITSFSQEKELKKKWSLGFSFTPNISYLYSPSTYFEGEDLTLPYNSSVELLLKDRPILEMVNFGIRISKVFENGNEIETGLTLSNKDYSHRRGSVIDIMPYLYSKPKIYFIELPITYKHKLRELGNYNMSIMGGIIASFPLYEEIEYSSDLYHYASSFQSIEMTQNLDFYPVCMNINLGIRFLRNVNRNIQFEFGPVFQSAIMPFSKKVEGNTIRVDKNRDIKIVNPDKGYSPYFIGVDLILRFNFFDLSRLK